jgi:hypothetical protein
MAVARAGKPDTDGGLRRRRRIILDHVDYVGDGYLLALNHPVWPNQSVLGNRDGNRELQFGCDVGGERRHDLQLGLVYRTIRRSYVSAGHDYGNFDPGHQQSGDGHGDGESGPASATGDSGLLYDQSTA